MSEYVWTAQRWQATGGEIRMGVKPPADSSHILWAGKDGMMGLTRLLPGMTLEMPRSDQQRPRLDGNELERIEPVGSDVFKLTVRFLVSGDVQIECPQLQQLADTINADVIQLYSVQSPAELFRVAKSDRWKAVIARAKLALFQQGLTLPSIGETRTSIVTEWIWVGSCLSYFVVGPQDEVVTLPDGLRSDNRQNAIGIVLDAPAPDEASMRAQGTTWFLRPLDRDSHQTTDLGCCYRLTTEKGLPIPLAAAVPRLGSKRPAFFAKGFDHADVTRPPLIVTARYGARLDKSKVVPSMDDSKGVVWDYGPSTFLFPLPIESSGHMQVFAITSSDGSELRLQNKDVPALVRATLPKHIAKNEKTYAFFNPAVPDSYGIFMVVCDIPKLGKWVVTSGIGSDEGGVLLSWRGFVDRASVLSIADDELKRHAVLFETGFELSPRRWFTAPFAGIAMDHNGGWWGALSSPDTRVLYEADVWSVSGEWTAINRAKRSASRRSAGYLQRGIPMLVALTGPEDGSAPILELGEGDTPKFVGWLADASHAVRLSPGVFRIGDPSWQEEFELVDGERLDSVRPDIREAYEAAAKLKSARNGLFGDLQWKRVHVDGKQVTIVSSDVHAHGICRFVADPS